MAGGDGGICGFEGLHLPRHVKYLQRGCLQGMPAAAAAYDSSRMTLAYFSLSGLDILHKHFRGLSREERKEAVDWIKSLYVVSPDGQHAGFHGGTYLHVRGRGHLGAEDHQGHIAMTFTALASLRILEAGYEGLDRNALLRGVRSLQRENGSFECSSEGGESDMRFVYCAAVICNFLNDTEEIGMDKDAAVGYIKNSITYEGAFAQGPHLEAHGGSTFCAVAALSLMGRLESDLTTKQRNKIYRWCANRLVPDEGFCGRPNKPSDTCYSFWVGATLKLLRPNEEVIPIIRRSVPFIIETQDNTMGGLSKLVGNGPDPLHTYLGLGGICLVEYPELLELHPALNISKRAAASVT